MIADTARDAPASKLILASTSTYRRMLFERLGVPFRCRTPHCDESILKGEESYPRELAERLAYQKASSLVREEPNAAIIGCDQLVSFQGRVFGKPATFARAVDQLETMAGETHELITAMVVICGEQAMSPYRCHEVADRLAIASCDRAIRRRGPAVGLRRQL